MEIRIQDAAASEQQDEGSVTLEVRLDLDDVKQLEGDAARAYAIERELPPEARTAYAESGDVAYTKDFIESRATNDALEARGIIPVAKPHVRSNAGVVSTEPYTCFVHVHPRPDIGLTSFDPVNLASSRIAKPGFSLKAAQAGAADVEYLDDVKALRIALTERLDDEIPEPAMRALGQEYETEFERELYEHGNDPETFRATHQIDEEQYTIMLTRRALGDARWNFALDAVFADERLTISEADVLAAFEDEFPGCSDKLLELHELRNDLYLTVEKVRRKKALDYLLENAIR